MSPSRTLSNVLTDHGRTIAVAVAALLVVFLLSALLGFVDVFGVVFSLIWFLLTVGVTVLVIWLFYRLVVAVESIAESQRALARASDRNDPPESPLGREPGTTAGDETDDADDTDETDGADDTDETDDGDGSDTNRDDGSADSTGTGHSDEGEEP